MASTIAVPNAARPSPTAPTRRAVARVAPRWLCGALLLLAWALHWRTFGLQELGQDGYLSVDLGASTLPRLLSYLARDVHPPLFFAALHAMFALAGEEYLIAKFLPIACSVLALAAIYRLGMELGGRWLGLGAAALLLVAAPFALLSPTVRPFTMGLFLSVLSLALTIRLLRAPRAPPVLLKASALALVTAAALLTWYLQPFFVALQVLLCLGAPGARLRTRDNGASTHRCALAPAARGALVGIGAGVLLALSWYVYVLPRLLQKLHQGATVTEGTPVLPSLHTLLAGLPPTIVGLTNGPLAAIALAGWLVALAAGVGAMLGYRRRCSSGSSSLAARETFASSGANAPPQRNAPLSDGEAGVRVLAFPLPFSRDGLLLVGLVLGVAAVGAILLRWQHPDAAGRYVLGVLPFAILLQMRALAAPALPVRALAAAGLAVAVAGQVVWFANFAAIPPHDYEQSAEASFLLQHLQPGDHLVFSDHGRRAEYMLNQRFAVHAPAAVVQTSGDRYLGDSPADATAAAASVLPGARRIWLLDTAPRPDRAPLARAALAARAYPAAKDHAGDTDIYLFLTQPPDTTRRVDQAFGGAALLTTAAYTSHATAGGAVTVDVQWRVLRPLGAPYSVFVHLDDASGQLKAQHDGIPAAGLLPTQDWRAGEVIDDRHGIVIPADLPPGGYRLDVGLYRADNGQRLTLPDGQNQLTLGIVQVAR